MTTLVLLPGMDGTGRLFGRFSEAASATFRTVVVSYPSDRLSDLGELRARVEEAVPASEEYVLVAESFSGAVAIEHAASRPPNLKDLVLCASFAAAPLPRQMGWARWRLWSCAFVGMFRLPIPIAVVRFFLVGGDAPRALAHEVKAVVDAVKPGVLADRLRQVMALDVRERLAAIEVPVLYLEGERDRLVGPRGVTQVRGAVKTLTHERIDGPHLLLQRWPDRSLEVIQRFLAGIVS